jgi:DNA-directed RNA polymerase beta subunit
MGDFPLMTDGGTFVINGAERVIVSQLVRSPAFISTANTIRPAKAFIHPPSSPTAAPGWNMRPTPTMFFYVRIDKNRKIPITVLIRLWARDGRRNRRNFRRRRKNPHDSRKGHLQNRGGRPHRDL